MGSSTFRFMNQRLSFFAGIIAVLLMSFPSGAYAQKKATRSIPNSSHYPKDYREDATAFQQEFILKAARMASHILEDGEELYHAIQQMVDPTQFHWIDWARMGMGGEPDFYWIKFIPDHVWDKKWGNSANFGGNLHVVTYAPYRRKPGFEFALNFFLNAEFYARNAKVKPLYATKYQEALNELASGLVHEYTHVKQHGSGLMRLRYRFRSNSDLETEAYQTELDFMERAEKYYSKTNPRRAKWFAENRQTIVDNLKSENQNENRRTDHD